MQSSVQDDEQVDVIVLGASIAGTITALALTACGWRVGIIDKATHPRFALGESMLKPTVLWMRLLAQRYDIPELDVVANYEKISREIGTTCGVKRSFGFVKHEKGNATVVDQWWSNVAVSYDAEVFEAHLFRQDIDSYLFRAASEKCAVVWSGTPLDELHIDSNGVCALAGEKRIQAKFLVDCTGPQSKLARDYQLRDTPARYRTESRSIFTHMINVKPFDQCEAARQPALNWHDGTLHHILEDGWIWVIPFDNHPQSTNPVVSVGMTWKWEDSPKKDLPAEVEWQSLLDQYPALAAQFEDAKIVRPWISTGKLQYSASAAAGDRFCLVGAAYGGIDALFSRGLLNTMQSIYLTVELIDSALHDNEFLVERFEPLHKLQETLLQINDQLTFGAYAGLRSSRLLTWWLTAWTLVEQKSIAHAEQALEGAAYRSPVSSEMESKLYSGLSISNESKLLEVLDKATAVMDDYRSGLADEHNTHSALLALSTSLASIGYNYPIYERLLKKLGFNQASRVLLQTEHNLVALLDEVDKHLDLPIPLRTHPVFYGLSRMICAGVVARRKQFDSLLGSVPVQLSLSGETLHSRLIDVMQKWITKPQLLAAGLESVEWIESIAYEHSPTGDARSQHDGTLLIRTVGAARSVAVYRQRSIDGNLQYEFLSDSEFGTVSLVIVAAPELFINFKMETGNAELRTALSS